MKWVFRHWSHHWSRKLKVFLWAIIAYQFIIWFSEYWFTETRLVTERLLIAVVIVEWLYPLHWIIRRALQLLLLFITHLWIIDIAPFEGWELTDSDSKLAIFYEWFYKSAHVFEQHLPYLPFTIGVWFALCFILWWAQTKGRIFFIIASSVIAFAIVDSYSSFVFWDQVLIIICSGLILIIVQHFQDVKRKYPMSWAYFYEKPGTFLAPAAIIISTVVLLGVMAPNARPLVTDPYTAWKNWREAQVEIGNNGTVTSIPNESSASGYGEDDSVLGEGFRFDHSVVMMVNTSRPSYWRGETKTIYNGSGWDPNPPGLSYDEAIPISTSLLETESVEQTIQMQTDIGFPVLFAAYEIKKLEQLDGDPYHILSEEIKHPYLEWSSHQSALLWTGPKDQYPKIYSMISQVPVIDETKLRQVTLDSIDVNVMKPYLQLPEQLPERVKTLAESITSEEDTLYDKVKAIETYLKTEYPYTNQPDLSRGQSEDFVDRFLFEIQEGYCDYYSTAMVVMLRTMGIPARWVKGYATGVPERGMDPFNRFQMYAGQGGTYVVTKADAHTWVEVYFDGWGWIPFEPTAGFTMPIITSEKEDQPMNEMTPGPTDPINQTQKQTQSITRSQSNPVVVQAAILVLIIVLLSWAVIKRRDIIHFFLQLTSKSRTGSYREQIVNLFERLLQYAKRRGYPHHDHETARETIARWVKQNELLADDLHVLTILYERARYSQRVITRDDVQEAAALCRNVKEVIKKNKLKDTT